MNDPTPYLAICVVFLGMLVWFLGFVVSCLGILAALVLTDAVGNIRRRLRHCPSAVNGEAASFNEGIDRGLFK